MIGFQYDRYFLGKDQYGSRYHALIQLTIGDLLFKSKLNSKQLAHQIQDFWVKKKNKKTSLGSVTGKGEWFYFFPVPVYAYTATICFLLNTSSLITHILQTTYSHPSFPNTAHTTYSELFFPSKREIPSHTVRRNAASKCFLSTEDGKWHRPETSHTTNVNYTNSPFGGSCWE